MMIFIIIECIFYFFLWTFILYWIHRIAHIVPSLIMTHRGHHKFVATHSITWHWSNVFLFNDDWISTADLWITEIIPTIIFVLITEQWWIGIAFYLYTAFIQEWLEHNKNFNAYPFYTAGQWHILHHTASKCNYGLFTPFWDCIFNTSRPIR